MYATCGGGFVSEEMVDYFDRMQVAARSYRLEDLSTRRRLHREDVAIRALLTLAETCGTEERATMFPVEWRGQPEDEAERIAREHGFSPDRLNAFRGLARSRGVPLEVVLRAALRGELATVVSRPAIRSRDDREESDS